MTLDKSFESCFMHFVKEANNAIFSKWHKSCISYNNDTQELDIENVDMVYFDISYISSKVVGTDYLDFYHFL
jgi:hypothetical protein